eukprot:8471771-Pyramimonas_sp.AAC.1
MWFATGVACDRNPGGHPGVRGRTSTERAPRPSSPPRPEEARRGQRRAPQAPTALVRVGGKSSSTVVEYLRMKT